jgi:hypothetical protein
MKRSVLFSLLFPTLVAASCQQNGSGDKTYERDDFKQYWYAGKAEVNSYNLVQSRYGEPRKGKAVLIFVTEDFSERKQVKLDDPSKASNDKVSVLKLNFTKNFITGIYPYSMMQSVFTPVVRTEHPASLKLSMSSQEWCGHVYTQINLRNGKYDVSSYSYFEQEGDAKFSLKKTLLEDEIWNLIRLDPNGLPIGNIEIIPGLFFTRLRHLELKPESATASLSKSGDTIIYSISVPGHSRTLTIMYEDKFPHKILGWTEQFKEREVMQETKASLDETLTIDYWTKNKNEFQYLRDSLNLSSTR